MFQTAISVSTPRGTIRGMAYRPGEAGGSAAARVPTALLLHGFTGHRIETGFAYVQLARALAAAGVAAVTFDFLHSGESDGDFGQMLVSGEVEDAVAMSRWLVGQPFVDRGRLALVGFSLGGLVAACTMGRTDAFSQLVLIAPTTVENLCRVASKGGGCNEAEGPIVVGPHTLHRDFVSDLRRLTPLEDVAASPVPTLLVQGQADTAVPPAVSAAYGEAVRAAGAALTERSIPAADHGFGTPATRAALLSAVTSWLGGQLIASPPC